MQTVTVVTAQPLTKDQLKSVETLIEKRVGKATIKQELDPSIIGGVKIQVGSQEFDASISGRLEKLERVSAVPVVTTAVPLTATQRASLSTSLEQKYGSSELQEVVDPAVLGGIKLVIGSEEFDGTIQGKLAKIKNSMLKAS